MPNLLTLDECLVVEHMPRMCEVLGSLIVYIRKNVKAAAARKLRPGEA